MQHPCCGPTTAHDTQFPRSCFTAYHTLFHSFAVLHTEFYVCLWNLHSRDITCTLPSQRVNTPSKLLDIHRADDQLYSQSSSVSQPSVLLLVSVFLFCVSVNNQGTDCCLNKGGRGACLSCIPPGRMCSPCNVAPNTMKLARYLVVSRRKKTEKNCLLGGQPRTQVVAAEFRCVVHLIALLSCTAG